jgi:maltose alpha-D-glucosyltransferase/alpha-amylase
MLRSFDYAALSALRSSDFRPEALSHMTAASNSWVFWVSVVFLQAYLEATHSGGFLPAGKPELKALLDLYLLHKGVYELNYELNNRPEWVAVPIRGVLDILEPAQ